MKPKVKIDPKSAADFQKAMGDLAAYSGEALIDVALKQAQLMCRESMMLTPPMGAGGKGGLTSTGLKAGQRSVEKDVRKLFVALDGKGIAPVFLLQQRMALAVKNNNKAEFQNLIRGSKIKMLRGLSPVLQKIAGDYDEDRAMRKAKNYFNKSNPIRSEYGLGFVKDMTPLHQAMLEKTGGRFKRGKTPINPLGSWHNKQVVQSEEALMAYIQRRQATVGRLKAGWWDALNMIPNPSPNGKEKEYGRAGVGDWIKAQATGQGRVGLMQTPQAVNMTIANLIGDANSVATLADTKGLVLGIRVANIQRDLNNRMLKAFERAKANAAKNKK